MKESGLKHVFAAVMALCAAPAWAGDWTVLRGADVEEALNDVTLQYDGATQIFYLSGKTLYDHGRPSWGNWTVRGDDYCSEWPPQDGWTCFALERHADGDRLRFVSESGAVTEGVIVE